MSVPTNGGTSGSAGASSASAGSSTASGAGASSGGSSGGSSSGAAGSVASAGGGSGGTAAGGVTTGGAATGGSGGEAASFGPAFQNVARLLQLHCGSVCHGGQEGFDGRNRLTNTDLGALYTHLTTPLTVDLCNGKTLVVPGSASTSLLLVAVKGLENDCVLPRMPIGCEGGSCVPPADIATLEAWIAAGAPKN